MNKKTIRITIAIALVAVAIAVYFAFSPEDNIFFPKCPFLMLTGLECPGCGSQRAIHHLLHLDIPTAFSYNPLAITALPYIFVGIYLDYFGGSAKFPKLRNALMGKKASITILILVLLYWTGRNLLNFI